MQRGLFPHLPEGIFPWRPQFSRCTGRSADSAVHGRCRKDVPSLRKCVFGQKCVLLLQDRAAKPPCRPDTTGSKQDSQTNREGGAEGRRPRAFERTSTPWFFPNPSAFRGFPASAPRRHNRRREPAVKRRCADPAIPYGTRDPAMRPLPQKYTPALPTCPE